MDMPQQPQQTQQPKEHSWGPAQVLTTIIIIAIILVIAFWFMGPQEANDRGSDRGSIYEQTQEIAPGQRLTTTQEGRVVSAFPEELLLEQNALVSDSFSINYQDTDATQPVVKYMSHMTLKENVDMFARFLNENEWAIAHEADASVKPVTFFYARKGTEEVNITFLTHDNDQVEVEIAYLMK